MYMPTSGNIYIMFDKRHKRKTLHQALNQHYNQLYGTLEYMEYSIFENRKYLQHFNRSSAVLIVLLNTITTSSSPVLLNFLTS